MKFIISLVALQAYASIITLLTHPAQLSHAKWLKASLEKNYSLSQEMISISRTMQCSERMSSSAIIWCLPPNGKIQYLRNPQYIWENNLKIYKKESSLEDE